jgi:hypothetical protein
MVGRVSSLILLGLRDFPYPRYPLAQMGIRATTSPASSNNRIAADDTCLQNLSMKTAYVVRELVSLPAGGNDFLTHHEYGTFRTYNEANECAIATNNPRCFPQREQSSAPKQEEILH